MGVVYKLKQEIIDFIIMKKKAQPSLSCRKLVDIIAQTFNIHVSKSSVNAIIKEHALSSPVGRTAVFKAPKNFFIPQNKKESLLANVAPFLQGASFSETRKERDVPIAGTGDADNFAVENNNEFVEAPVVPVRLMPDILAKHVPKKKIKAETVWKDKGVLYEDAGTIFLRAALWDVSREPVLGRLLKEWAGERDENKDSFIQWENLLFGVEPQKTEPGFSEKKQIEGGSFFSKEGMSTFSLSEIIKKSTLSVSEEVAWEIALKGLLATAGAVRLVTRKGNVFRMHPGLKKVYDTDNEQAIESGSLYKTMEMVADRLINNIRPLVSEIPLQHPQGERLFLELTDALEGQVDAIERIEILDENNKVVNVFEGLSSERRGYIFLTDVKEVFGEKRGGVLERQELFLDRIQDKEVAVGIGTVLLAGNPFSVMKEQAEDEATARVFMSNLLDQPEQQESVFQEAAGFFPYGRREKSGVSANVVVFDGQVCVQQKGVYGTFREFLYRLAESRYFKQRESLVHAITLPGYIKQSADAIHIRVVCPSEDAYLQEIKEAICRINENVIFDHEGRRVFVFFEERFMP